MWKIVKLDPLHLCMYSEVFYIRSFLLNAGSKFTSAGAAWLRTVLLSFWGESSEVYLLPLGGIVPTPFLLIYVFYCFVFNLSLAQGTLCSLIFPSVFHRCSSLMYMDPLTKTSWRSVPTPVKQNLLIKW